MNYFFFDASALAKRYNPEIGTGHINRIFNEIRHSRLMCLMLGAAEVVSVLIRRRNGGAISAAVCAQGVLNLQDEVVASDEFHTLEASNHLITAALPFIDRHSLNATDTIVLRLALDLSAQLRATGDVLVLIASDHRLLRAALAEGLLTFDPERQTEAEVEALLAPR